MVIVVPKNVRKPWHNRSLASVFLLTNAKFFIINLPVLAVFCFGLRSTCPHRGEWKCTISPSNLWRRSDSVPLKKDPNRQWWKPQVIGCIFGGLELQTTSFLWLFQLDDSKSLHKKWLFHQTSIKKLLFRVPGGMKFLPSQRWWIFFESANIFASWNLWNPTRISWCHQGFWTLLKIGMIRQVMNDK